MINIFYSFLLVGIICMIASLIYDLTKFTPGHITSLFVVLGAVLSIFGIYDMLIETCGYGLSLPITSFGNSLVNGAVDSYHQNGILGLFTGIYDKVNAGISSTLLFSFIISIIFKPKD